MRSGGPSLRLLIFSAAITVSSLSLVYPVCAQQTKTQRPTQLTINFNLSRPGEINENDDAVGARTDGLRKSLYEMAARECEKILATIATSCKLTNVDVNVNQQAHNAQPAMLNAALRATYTVEFKGQ